MFLWCSRMKVTHCCADCKEVMAVHEHSSWQESKTVFVTGVLHTMSAAAEWTLPRMDTRAGGKTEGYWFSLSATAQIASIVSGYPANDLITLFRSVEMLSYVHSKGIGLPQVSQSGMQSS
jgi:hypothetical protein